MRGPAHLTFGIFNGYMLTQVMQPNFPIGGVMVAVSAVASLVPDIDSRNSIISHKLPIISFITRIFFGHRTFFHSSLFLLILYVFLHHSIWGISFIVGYGGHLLQDLFTKGGLPLLYPIKKTFHLSPFETGGIMDWITTGVLVCIIFAIIQKGWI